MRAIYFLTLKKLLFIGGLLLGAFVIAPAQDAVAQGQRYDSEVIEGEALRLWQRGRQLADQLSRFERQVCISREGKWGFSDVLFPFKEEVRQYLRIVRYGDPGAPPAPYARELDDLSDELETRFLKLKTCPRPYDPLGNYVGVYVVKTQGNQHIKEFFAVTGVQTNDIYEVKDPLGVGVVAGRNFALSNGMIIGPYVSLEFLKMNINRTFAGGTFIGSTTHWFATAGAKVGMMTPPGVFLYGLGGVSLLNHDLNINFGGPVTSDNRTTPGGTLGFGAELRPSMLQGFGIPVGVFFQYQHTWWADAKLNRPAASPLFNYTYIREDRAGPGNLDRTISGISA